MDRTENTISPLLFNCCLLRICCLAKEIYELFKEPDVVQISKIKEARMGWTFAAYG
jgi:hypothetical protein